MIKHNWVKILVAENIYDLKCKNCSLQVEFNTLDVCNFILNEKFCKFYACHHLMIKNII